METEPMRPNPPRFVVIMGNIKDIPPHLLVELSNPNVLVFSEDEAMTMGLNWRQHRYANGMTNEGRMVDFNTTTAPKIPDVKVDFNGPIESPQPWKRKGKGGYKTRY